LTLTPATDAPLKQSAEVVIIGGGAAGVCCAYELARRGRDVLLLERGDLCAGSSYGNAALVAPSRSLPLGGPGVIGQSLRWLLEPRGAFRLRPRADAELARWLLAFRRSCSDGAALHAAVVVRDLTRESLAVYEELAGSLEFGFRKRGLLELFRTPTGRAAAEAEARRLAAIGVETTLLDTPGVAKMLPNVDSSVLGALWCAEDAHLDPPLFVRRLAAEAERYGAVLETHTEVVRLRTDRDRIDTLETSRGTIRPETVVLANGAWAARTGRALGLRLLIEPAKGYSFQLDCLDGDRPAVPLILSEARTTVTPIGDGVRVTSKLDLVGFDASVRGRRVAAIPQAVDAYVRLPSQRKLTETWCGFRPLTPDGLPLVGRTPTYANLVLAAGGGRMGLALAPVMARLVAQTLGGVSDHPHLRELTADRFLRPVGTQSSRGRSSSV
jgi:D-amino-acid dehydrogenase